MDIQSVLTSIKQQDKAAFRELVKEYGRGLYIKLYAASGDAEAARQATKAAFAELYMALNSQQGPDVLESLLYSLGEKKQRELLQRQAARFSSECFEETVKLPASEKPATLKAEPTMEGYTEYTIPQANGDISVAVQQEPAHRGMDFWQWVLLLLAAAGLWYGIGMLMGAGHLPKYDLGYSWFNLNIARWFTWL